MADASDKMRLDKWLWHARFFKTRSLSAKVIAAGHVRVNSTRVSKPAFAVSENDVLTFPQAKQIRVIRVLAMGSRRGPAPEAQALYEELTPQATKSETSVPDSPKFEGKGRPTKRDRRKLDLNTRGTLE